MASSCEIVVREREKTNQDSILLLSELLRKKEKEGGKERDTCTRTDYYSLT